MDEIAIFSGEDKADQAEKWIQNNPCNVVKQCDVTDKIVILHYRNIGSVPIKVAAQVYGKDPSWVRAGIITGYLPIGIATRNGEQIKSISEINGKKGRINYYISPIKLYEHTGYEWKGKNEKYFDN